MPFEMEQMRKHQPRRPRADDADLCAMIHLFLESIVVQRGDSEWFERS